MNNGTLTVSPVSSFASLVAFVAVFPFTAGSPKFDSCVINQ